MFDSGEFARLEFIFFFFFF